MKTSTTSTGSTGPTDSAASAAEGPTKTSATPSATPRKSVLSRLLNAFLDPSTAVYPIMVALFVVLILLNPTLGEPDQFTRLIGRIAPIVIVTLGQYFVLVSGEFDLSQGAVIGVQVVVAGSFIGDDNSRIVPGLLLMLAIGVGVGAFNGLATAYLKIPGFMTTLGTMFMLGGMTRYLTGGAASGNPSEQFREVGRGGIDVPLLGYLPWSVLVLAGCLVVAAVLARRPVGRLLVARGDNPTAVSLAGANRGWLMARGFIASSLFATVAAIVLVGFAGTHPTVGQGYQYTAIAAAVVGGVVLGGGRGLVLSAAAGAFVLETLVAVLNASGIDTSWRATVQGLLIILALTLTAARTKLGPLLTLRRRSTS